MLRKKIAALLAAVITISTFGATGYAATGDTIDKVLGSIVTNGMFEQSVKDWTVTDGTTIERDINNTHNDSAGAAYISQTATSFVTALIMPTNNAFYRAKAYVKLKDGAQEDNAQIVLEKKYNGEAVASSAATTVSSDDWTLIECDFQYIKGEDVLGFVTLYIKCNSETEFYLDDVTVIEVPTTWTNGEIVSGEDTPDGEGMAVKITPDSDYAQHSFAIKGNVEYEISAKVMVVSDSDESCTAEAFASYQKGRGYQAGEAVTLTYNEWEDVSCTAVINTSDAPRNIRINVEGVAEGDTVYFKDFSLKMTSPVTAAVTDIADIDEVVAGTEVGTAVSTNADTDAVRYFFLVADSADPADEWTVIQSYQTNSGIKPSVISGFAKAELEGKYIKLRVVPVDKAGRTGVADESNAALITKLLEVSLDDKSADSAQLTISNNFGSTAAVSVVVACYNDRGEMIGIGVQKQDVGDTDVSFDVTATLISGVTAEDIADTMVYVCEAGSGTGLALKEVK